MGAAGYDGTLTGSDSANVMVGPYLPLADIDVTSTITDITAPIVAGQPYSFTVEVSNNGPAMAEGLTVHDLIQGIPGVQVTNILTAPNWFCSGDLTCTRQNPMAVTTETVATVTVIIPANTPAGAYRHLLAATADNPDANLANNVKSYPFTVTTKATLGITKGDLDEPLVAGGAPVLYTVVISNSGPSDAYNVVVTETLLAPNTYLVSLDVGDLPMTCTRGGGATPNTGTCTIPTIPAGESRTFYATVRALSSATPSAPAVNTSVNQACVVGSTNTVDNLTPDVCVTENTRIDAIADLAVTKSGPITVTTGDAFNYTVSIYNNGPSDASSVVMTDTLPPGVVVSGALPGGCAQPTTGVVVCTVDSLVAGASTQQVIAVRADPAVCFEGKVNNYVTVSPDRYVSSTGSPPFLPEPDPTNNQADWGTIIFSQADLQITKTASNPVIAGETATFTLTVNNAGPGCATDVRVIEELNSPDNPPGMEQIGYVADASTQGGAPPLFGYWYACTSGVCERGAPMPPNTIDTIRITAQVPANAQGSYTNWANVFGNMPDANPANNIDDAQYTVNSSASVVIEKGDLMDPVVVSGSPDDVIFYVITVRSNGPSTARNVVVTDTLAPAMKLGNDAIVNPSYAPGPGNGVCSSAGGNLVCNLGDIPAGQTVEIYVPVALVDPAAACVAGTVQNSALAAWTDTQNGAQQTSPVSESVGLLCQSDIDIKKVGPTNVTFGDGVASGFPYTLTVTNIGASPMVTGTLSIVEYLPAELTFAGVDSWRAPARYPVLQDP